MSNEQQKVLVISFGRTHYVHEERYYSSQDLVINGRRGWPQTPDAPFRVVDEPVTSVARYAPPRTVVTRYELRGDLVACADRLRKFLTPEEHDRLPERDQALYAPQREERDEPPVPMAFEIVDGLAKPRAMPQGIVCKSPKEVYYRKWFVWTLPCVATRDYVFEQLKGRVAKLDPAHFSVTVYASIHVIRVSVSGIVVGGVEYRPAQDLLHIARDKGGCPAIEGDNLDACLKNVEAYVAGKMIPIEAALDIKTCPACRRSLKRTKARVAVRGPAVGRRPGHNID